MPEMASFAELYGFQFLCHEIRHPNRKAGEERSFWTVETNFLPGRSFAEPGGPESASAGVGHGPHGAPPGEQDGLDSGQGLRARRSYLTALPAQLPAPYWPQERGTDAYGYVSFEGNYYWVPGNKREDVKVLRDKVIVVQSRDLNDPQAVRLHLRNIAQAMGRGDLIIVGLRALPRPLESST